MLHLRSEADWRGLAEMAEQFMERERWCYVCHFGPVVAPMVCVFDDGDDGRVHGLAFGLCPFCLADEDMQRNVQQALNVDRAKARAVWN